MDLKIKIKDLNAYIIFMLLFQVVLANLNNTGLYPYFLNYYNEVIYVIVMCLSFVVVLQSERIKKIQLLIFIILFYQLFQIILRSIPFKHILQSIVYIQCIIFYSYFYFQSDDVKNQTLIKLSILLKKIIYIVILFAVFEVFNPRILREFLGTSGINTERGFNGFIFTSIFGTSTGLSQFVFLIITVYYIYYGLTRKFWFSKIMFFILIALGILTFSRKEIFLIIAMVIIGALIVKYGEISLKKLLFPSLFGALFIFLFFSIYLHESNEIAFSDTYVRYQMADFSFQISKDYFPFGTGPGTFGSQMSVEYPVIYEKYKVGPNITGYGSKRGPIYDAFLFTFITEMGLGIMFYLFLGLYIYRRPVLENSYLINAVKKTMLFALFVLGLFSPIIMNPFGLICFSVLGLITKNKNI